LVLCCSLRFAAVVPVRLLCISALVPLPMPPFFPYTNALPISARDQPAPARGWGTGADPPRAVPPLYDRAPGVHRGHGPWGIRARDRKSTRLNSSHGSISYAVFCFQQKKESSPYLHTHTSWNTP